jgi:hypothetical protein
MSTKSSNYLIITTRKNEGSKAIRDTLGEKRLPTAKRIARFILRHCNPDSVVIVNMHGKVGMYEVAGHPEKSELRLAREMN